MVEVKKNEHDEAQKKIIRLYKKAGFSDGMFNGSLAEGLKKK